MSTGQHIKRVGVIGAGSFGMAIAQLLAQNVEVLVYSRRMETVERVNGNGLPEVRATNNVEKFAASCYLIFPVVPSGAFRDVMKQFAPFLRPDHILIHGTKGFDVVKEAGRTSIHAMSDVIEQETNVVRIGCLAGPNLAAEIMEGQPTATVIGSPYEEVIALGKEVLSSKHFHVFGNSDMRGAEIAGALKNIVALGSGMLSGMGLGKNIQAVFINRGLKEMIRFGEALGAEGDVFLDVAGIGDLIATTTSEKSRNFTFGARMGAGASFKEAMADSSESPEGIRTLNICKKLAKRYNVDVPLFQGLYDIVYNDEPKDKIIEILIRS